jgi:CRISPR-associated protein Csm4
MNTLKFTIKPEGAFGTPLAGDTLFGQLCWALRWRLGERGLEDLLEGYTQGRPFAVVSDAQPAGRVNRPAIPMGLLVGFVVETDPSQRKAARQARWLNAADQGRPVGEWLKNASAHKETTVTVTQNTINRMTGTTGKDAFAPRQVTRIALGPEELRDIYVVLDESRLARADFQQALEDIGATGFGRDATTGLGKFRVINAVEHQWQQPASSSTQAGALAAITLGPCAPVADALDAPHCYFQPLTRFGRHGDVHAVGANPFKKPVLLLRGGAWLTLKGCAQVPAFHGRGLGGEGDVLSFADARTVHQGYAPLVPVIIS